MKKTDSLRQPVHLGVRLEDHRTVKILSPVPGHLRRHGSAGGKEKDGPQSRLSVLCHKLYPSYGQIHPDYMV